jgi:hypothetical protein
VEDTLLQGRKAQTETAADARSRELLRELYFALQRLQEAGIQTLADEEAGAWRYVELRQRWNRDIANLASATAYTLDEIDPASSRCQGSDSEGTSRKRFQIVE